LRVQEDVVMDVDIGTKQTIKKRKIHTLSTDRQQTDRRLLIGLNGLMFTRRAEQEERRGRLKSLRVCVLVVLLIMNQCHVL